MTKKEINLRKKNAKELKEAFREHLRKQEEQNAQKVKNVCRRGR